MGFKWNVILSFDNEEWWEDDEPRDFCEPLERINQWIPHGQLVDLVTLPNAAGARCGMDANLYGGGFYHFDIEGFIELVRSQDWKARSKVQLWVKGAEEGMGDEPFTPIKLGRRRSGRATPKGKSSPPSQSTSRSRGKVRRG